MELNLPSVDVIIVNYNGMHYLDSCLDSLLKTEYPLLSVIMVDNGSTDGSMALVKKKYPQVTIIGNKSNLGFGKANQIGIRAGKSEFVALLNNDTVVEKTWLLPLVKALMEDEQTAAVCSKLLFMNHPRVTNGIGGGMNYIGYGYDIGMYESANGTHDEKRDVFFPCAAACLFRKSAFEAIGGFDDKFFMYHEDVDLGWRLWLRGYRVQCVHDSVVYHAFGGTSGKSESLAFRNTLGLRHALRSLIKNYELSTLLKILPVFLALGVRTTLKERSPIFIKCILWNFKMLPDTLKERRVIQKNRKVTDKELSHLIWQEIRLPVYYPDYKLMNLKTFVESKNRRHFIDFNGRHDETLGYGWYGIEAYPGDGKIQYRWSKDEAVFYLWNGYGNGIISMEVVGLSTMLQRQRRVLISVNDKLSHEFAVKSDGWGKIEIPYTGEKGPLEIKISVDETWVPDDLFKNGDKRKLGIGIKRAELAPMECHIPSIDGISVIIPTYNRIAMLLKTLRSLEDQTLSKDTFEVLVIDDGSTDATESELKSFISQTRLNIRCFRQENKKQGAARNLGIKHAREALIVIIGDDTIPSETLLEEHLRYHRKHNKQGNLVAIGYTQWPKEMRATPFMKFIGEYGYQFGFSLIKGEGPLPFNFFYTSNISLLKTFLDELEYLFEEDFATYGWEDIELGFRLERIGMKLFYNRNAIAYHHHPTDIPSFCRRQFDVGKASRVFLRKHPELEWFLGNAADLKKFAFFGSAVTVLERVLNFMDKTFSVPLPRILYDIALKANYAKGATAARD